MRVSSLPKSEAPFLAFRYQDEDSIEQHTGGQDQPPACGGRSSGDDGPGRTRKRLKIVFPATNFSEDIGFTRQLLARMIIGRLNKVGLVGPHERINLFFLTNCAG